MKAFVYDFQGLVPEFGQMVITADDRLEADQEFDLRVQNSFPEMIDIEITNVREDD